MLIRQLVLTAHPPSSHSLLLMWGRIRDWQTLEAEMAENTPASYVCQSINQLINVVRVQFYPVKAKWSKTDWGKDFLDPDIIDFVSFQVVNFCRSQHDEVLFVRMSAYFTLSGRF